MADNQKKSMWVKITFVIDDYFIIAYLAKETDRMIFINKEFVEVEEMQNQEFGLLGKIEDVNKFYNKDHIFSIEILDNPPVEGFVKYDD